ncbi:NADH-quinone oxidoreductase subunit N [Buchnera aphidicola (Pterocallis alni)]
MIIPVYRMISFIPFILLITSIMVIMCSIIIKRNHFFVMCTTVIGLFFTLISLLFLLKFHSIHFNILLRCDFYSIIYSVMMVLCTLYISIISYFYIKKFFLYKEEFYVLILSSLLGGLLLVFANHIISIFVGLEVMSIPTIGMMTYSLYYQKCLNVVLKYVILSSLASICMLFGIAIIYSVCGNLSLYNIKVSFLINTIYVNQILLLGLALFLFPFFFKLALFPFYFWVSSIYENISSFVLIYLSTVIKISIISLLIKLFVYFPHPCANVLYLFLEIISIFSIIFGSIMSVLQKNIKKLFGYASIVHIGYILIPIFTINNYFILNKVILLYLINYVLGNIGIFTILCLSKLYYDYRLIKLNDLYFYKGFFWKQPILSISMTIIILSFLGIPFTFGFITKFYIIFISVLHSCYFANLGILISMSLGIFYYLKIILNIYSFNKNIVHQTLPMMMCRNIEYFILFIAFTIFVLGIFPQIILHFV